MDFFFENFDHDFGTLVIGMIKSLLEIWTRRPRNRLYANFGKFGSIVSLKYKRLAYFFGDSVFFYKTLKSF